MFNSQFYKEKPKKDLGDVLMEKVDLERKEEELESEIKELKNSIGKQGGTLRDLIEQNTQLIKETREILNKDRKTLKIKKEEYIQIISKKIIGIMA